MTEASTRIVADLLAIDEHSFTVAFQGPSLEPGLYYSIDGIGLDFLAGKLVWTRAGRAGLFFRHPIHQSVLQEIQPLIGGKIQIGLRRVPTSPAPDAAGANGSNSGQASSLFRAGDRSAICTEPAGRRPNRL